MVSYPMVDLDYDLFLALNPGWARHVLENRLAHNDPLWRDKIMALRPFYDAGLGPHRFEFEYPEMIEMIEEEGCVDLDRLRQVVTAKHPERPEYELERLEDLLRYDPTPEQVQRAIVMLTYPRRWWDQLSPEERKKRGWPLESELRDRWNPLLASYVVLNRLAVNDLDWREEILRRVPAERFGRDVDRFLYEKMVALIAREGRVDADLLEQEILSLAPDGSGYEPPTDFGYNPGHGSEVDRYLWYCHYMFSIGRHNLASDIVEVAIEVLTTPAPWEQEEEQGCCA
ncbi:MAG: hypothetical protein GXY76_20760 [Chloroflexi bacterium]|nr:hypothetical protein [Chloroflexota bacterium]